jgi:exonuclease VII small subunit
MSNLERKRLYKEASTALQKAQQLLLDARARHEQSIAAKTEKAA